jgi:hypothetical protein
VKPVTGGNLSFANAIRRLEPDAGRAVPGLAQQRGMEHLIPTLLGIAGALAPVAFYWKQAHPAELPRFGRSSRLVAFHGSLVADETVIRGGRVYL